MFFDFFECFHTDNMLDPAGIINCGFFSYPQFDQYFRKDTMTLIDTFSDLQTGFGQRKGAALIYIQITVVFQQIYGAADAGFAESHLRSHIHRMHFRIILTEDIYRLQIHFA